MAYTQQDLDALNEAIAMGVQSVRYSDRTVNFHSLDEMLRLKNLMQAEIDEAATGVTKRRRRTFLVYQSGNGLG